MRAFLTPLALACALAAASADAQTAAADERAIREAIARHYFAAHATGRGASLEGWFVPEGRMMSVQNDLLRVVPSATYIGGFTGTPPADEARRARRVVMVDVAGDAAIAKVELDYPTAVFTDYFQLLKVGGAWKLVNKVFHRRPKS
jgi:hypothetical protein